MHFNPKQAAFTLIEVAIALVIIGLLIGGILVGKDLIEISQARKLLTQAEQIELAVRAFKLKYNCIPGDCNQASELGIGPNGDNPNGLVDGRNLNGTGGCLASPSTSLCLTDNQSLPTGPGAHSRTRGELQYFWVHLANTNLYTGSFDVMPLTDAAVTEQELNLYFPKDALGKGHIMVFTWGRRLYLRTGVRKLDLFKNADVTTPVINASQMKYMLDKQGADMTIDILSAYNSLYAPNPKIAPLGAFTTNPAQYLYLATADRMTGGNWTACAVPGGGGYQLNITGNGNCNVMFRIDY